MADFDTNDVETFRSLVDFLFEAADRSLQLDGFASEYTLVGKVDGRLLTAELTPPRLGGRIKFPALKLTGYRDEPVKLASICAGQSAGLKAVTDQVHDRLKRSGHWQVTSPAKKDSVVITTEFKGAEFDSLNLDDITVVQKLADDFIGKLRAEQNARREAAAAAAAKAAAERQAQIEACRATAAQLPSAMDGNLKRQLLSGAFAADIVSAALETAD